MSDTLRVLVLGPRPMPLRDGEWAAFEVTACADLEGASAALRSGPFDAVLLQPQPGLPLAALRAWDGLAQALLDAAVLLHGEGVGAPDAAEWLAVGAQDLLPPGAAAELPRALRLAVERKRIERQARRAQATDLATGLPDHAQLLEHMTHLVALREREPAPMALIVLRVDGLAATAATLGAESAQVLRRKAAVRLRAALRASDVVAALGADRFAVLLGWMDAPADAQRVADKLASALRQPFRVAGREAALAVVAGLAVFPQHGRDADTLLRHAAGAAAASPARGRAGDDRGVERGRGEAANDEAG